MKKAAQILTFDLNCINKQTRLSPRKKNVIALFIYFGKQEDFQIKKTASFVGLTYSSISKQASLFRERLLIDKELEEKHNDLNSQFKV